MFDVSNLPFRDQFEAAVIVSGVCLAAAVVLREWFADRDIRLIARILGAAGWAVVVTFAWRMTETNETLATQLIVKHQKASEIAEQACAMTMKTNRGTVFEVSENGVRTISGTDGNGSTGDRGNRRGDFAIAEREERSNGNNVGLLDAISNVLEWHGSTRFRADGISQRNAETF